MPNNNIVTALDFLVKDYRCSLSYEFDRGNKYLYDNGVFKVIIFQWQELGDLDIHLVYNMQDYRIDPSLEEPKALFEMKSKTRGIKRFFYDYEKDFWRVVSMIIKRKLKQFGIAEQR